MKPLVLNIPTIAVTGSAGKTTTKEMIASVLQVKWNTFKSKKTRNQRYHTRLHAKQIKPRHQAVVLEFGLGRKNAGKIHCRYIQPNIGVITNVGSAHFGMLGNSIKSTAEYKSALIRYMKPNGILLINRDDKNSELLQTKNFKGEIITVGINNKADYQAEDVKYLDKGMSFKVKLDDKIKKFFLPAFGLYNVVNALFAIAISYRLKFKPSEIRAGLKKYRAPNCRFNLIKLRDQSFLIDDTYNSNPEAVKAAVDTLLKLGKEKKKIAVLGSMLELGRYSSKGHEEVGKYLSKKVDVICSFGKRAEYIKTGAVNEGHKKVVHFNNRKDLHRWLKKNIGPSTIILVKGSNRMRMRETVNYLKNNFQGSR
ncbi:MAG: UDP-N-acetylmuramoyl-tripeptide--D-alanyl-D-alanine ligase [Firmicutes bacterium HGW-Firmicutes-13]|nr:MAG: UDP-N-acetylmuramoyl-tripeptide--D-alanyl-D-alanine ligase [Firmicutes bacterium HGW-Firmicutes-13]